MPKLTFNAVTGKFDLIGMTADEVEAYLKLDQTTPQIVENGSPTFGGGVTIRAGQRLILDGI